MLLPYLSVAAGIIWRKGRFLAARRPLGKAWAGYWEFPGGKIETGESAAQALTRELEEELDIHCTCMLPWRVVRYAYPELEVELHLMHVPAFQGAPVPKDGQELRWVTSQEALTLAFLPADAGIVADIVAPSA